jgi:hypothetical protein
MSRGTQVMVGTLGGVGTIDNGWRRAVWGKEVGSDGVRRSDRMRGMLETRQGENRQRPHRIMLKKIFS